LQLEWNLAHRWMTLCHITRFKVNITRPWKFNIRPSSNSLLNHLLWKLANDYWFLNYSTVSKFVWARFFNVFLVFVWRDVEVHWSRNIEKPVRRSKRQLLLSYCYLKSCDLNLVNILNYFFHNFHSLHCLQCCRGDQGITAPIDHLHVTIGSHILCHVDACSHLRRHRWSCRWHVVQHWESVRFRSSPPGLGTAYQTTLRQRQPAHHSVLRWRRICL